MCFQRKSYFHTQTLYPHSLHTARVPLRQHGSVTQHLYRKTWPTPSSCDFNLSLTSLHLFMKLFFSAQFCCVSIGLQTLLKNTKQKKKKEGHIFYSRALRQIKYPQYKTQYKISPKGSQIFSVAFILFL